MVSLKFIIGLIALIVLAHILAIINSWYWIFVWIDMPMHFLGGFWLAAVFLYFIKPKLEILNYKLLISIILVLGFVVLIGVLWEFFEFFSDIFIVSKGYAAVAQQGTGDTMADLFFDIFGGFTAFIVYRFQPKKNNLPL